MPASRLWSRSGCATLQGCRWLRGPLIQREGERARGSGRAQHSLPRPAPAARREERGPRHRVCPPGPMQELCCFTSQSCSSPTCTTIQHGRVCISALLDSGAGSGDFTKRAQAAQEKRRGLWGEMVLGTDHCPGRDSHPGLSAGERTPWRSSTAVRPREESQAFRREATCADG